MNESIVTVAANCPMPDDLHDVGAVYQERLLDLLEDARHDGVRYSALS